MNRPEFSAALGVMETHPVYHEKTAAEAQAEPPSGAVPSRGRRARPAPGSETAVTK